jgi:hypothetical protein
VDLVAGNRPQPPKLWFALERHRMKYLVPFASLKQTIRFVSEKGSLKADMTYDEFLDVVRKLLAAIPVDETWYRATYPDVAEAIDAGIYTSATGHFVEHGYLEGRRPFPFEVNEAWYLETYPDVQEGIESGEILSAQDHYNLHGYDEGRMPAPV